MKQLTKTCLWMMKAALVVGSGALGLTAACGTGSSLDESAENESAAESAGPAMQIRGRNVIVRAGDPVASLADGTDFSNVVPQKTRTRTFLISNVGTTSLRLDRASIRIIGPDAKAFTLRQPSKTVLAPGENTTLQIVFRPQTRGSFRATVEIPNNVDAAPARFAIMGSGSHFPSFSDEHTLFLWLFDENPYGAYTTLFDASPQQTDLLMMEEGRLVRGRHGNALESRAGAGYHVSFAGWQGDMVNEHMRGPDGTPSGQWAPTVEPWSVLDGLMGSQWTFELHARFPSKQPAQGTLLDLGEAYANGFTITINSNGSLRVVHHYAGLAWTLPGDPALFDGAWHHLAIVRLNQTLSLFVDGRRTARVSGGAITSAPLPIRRPTPGFDSETRGFDENTPQETRRQNRFNLSLAENRRGASDLTMLMDEVRFSQVARYDLSLTVPGTFARNLRTTAPKPTVPSGPPLLFDGGRASGTVNLGQRKHLFIDDVLIDEMDDIDLQVHPLGNREDLLLETPNGVVPFVPPEGRWKEMVYDHEGLVYLFASANYSSDHGNSQLFVSSDGIRFRPVQVGAHVVNGSTANNLVFHEEPLGAFVMKDSNPNVAPEERFKIFAFAPNRAIILYVSPDGLHWRRNEVPMLPLMTGGEPEAFYDDQRGAYVMYVKRDSGSRGGSGLLYRGRRSVMFRTNTPFAAWPMKAANPIYYEGWPVPTITEEGPAVIEPIIKIPVVEEYDVFRARPHKYEWAPDTYIALPWMGFENYLDPNDPNTKRRRVRLAVSRDGVRWKYFTDDWFLDNVGSIEGVGTKDVQSFQGMIRRGNEIWMYAEYSTENNGDGRIRFSRLRIGLDRFTSLRAHNRGHVLTRPFRFSGSGLTLNVATRGSKAAIRVGIQDQNGNKISGFEKEDADTIRHTTDDFARRVTWRGRGDVSALAGREVRLYLEIEDASVYGFQFVP